MLRLFADTVAGANFSETLCSLLQTCQVNGIDGCRYLRALFIKLLRAQNVDDYAALLSWRMQLGAALSRFAVFASPWQGCDSATA